MRPDTHLMRMALAAALAAGLGAAGTFGDDVRTPPAARPALVVMIAVDQLRADLLDRYDVVFTGGFRRLREQGRWFRNATVDHAITVSHPGHATLATGMHPSHHGIVDAAFYDGPPGGRIFLDALEDASATIVGAAGRPGVSPRRFLAPTLAEWMQAAGGADGTARVVAVGSGRYSSLLHAGRARGDVYWYEPEAGRFVTSSFYRGDDPAWVRAFNGTALPKLIAAATTWDNGVRQALRELADSDDSRWEADHQHVTFPHRLVDLLPPGRRVDAQARARWFTGTPMLDGATLRLAEAAVTSLRLGHGKGPDYLGIVPSQVDDIGHWYGPSSQEQLDNLRRLDLALGHLFETLDREVGAGRWVAALSADHGVIDVPEWRQAHGLKARRLAQKEIGAVLAQVQEARAGGGSPDEVAARVARAVEASDFVADAMTPGDLFAGEPANSYVELYRHSSRPDRLPRFPLFDFETGRSVVAESGVEVRLLEGVMPDLDPAVHGSPYLYDRSVPIVFMGPGVTPGTTDEPARTVDVAPTLARLAGIATPADLDGRPLPMSHVAETQEPKTWLAANVPTY